MRAKILVSSLSCQIWLESFSFEESEYSIGIKGSKLHIGQDFIEGDGRGDAEAILSVERIMDFIAILKHLQDQPIVLAIDDNRLWLWQAIL